MINRVNIERECEHKILIRQDLVLLITVVEFINALDEVDRGMKFASTNVSIINDNCGPQLSKIVGSGHTVEKACKDCLRKFNANKSFFEEENKILLCCSEIPHLQTEDLRDFNMTRTFKLSWRNHKGEICLLKAYVRDQDGGLIYIYDGDDKCRTARTDREVIEFILSDYNFDEQPDRVENKRRGNLFYPTTQEFLR